jgi:3-oxoadipate enol-lactonase/4-carboxymuconolactone decarboxylase
MSNETNRHSGASSSVTGPAGAQTLLLLDEPGAGAATWSAIAGPLAEQFRVIRLGRHIKQDTAQPHLEMLGQAAIEALDAAGSERAHVAGCGLGGAVALWLAIHHPERVARIAVMGASASVKDPAFWTGLAARLRAGETEFVADKLIRGWLTPALRDRDAALVKTLAGAIASNATDELARSYETLAKLDLQQDLGRVATPVLIMLGEEDPFVAVAEAEKLHAALPRAILEVIPQTGHLVTIEHPARVAKMLLDHFGSAATLETGFRSRRVALGDPHVDKTIAAITPFTRSFQDFLTRYCWGEVWTRSGLSRRDRSLATISVLVAIGAEHEIPVHVRAGLRHGLKIEEFPELYEQLALYTGLPRAFGALNITQKTLLEDGLLPTKKTP